MSVQLKKHNPKSHAPAVYIPCWLIQVPNKLLSFAAKCLYGRLSQWSSESGDVFRSYNQLAQEIGSSRRSVNDYLRELRVCGLIGTMQPQAGGLNHFVFYEHPWMNEPINQFLCYKPEPDPEQDSALPRAGFCSTPEQNPARINKKEIRENKKDNNIYSVSGIPEEKTKREYQETLFPMPNEKTNLPGKDISLVPDFDKENPHDIPRGLIDEWKVVRKAKRSPITPTAWKRLNQEIQKCNCSPIEAFEEMLSRGWLTVKAEWINKNKSNNQQKGIYDDSISQFIPSSEYVR